MLVIYKNFSYKFKLILSEHLKAFKDEYNIPDDYRIAVTILILKRGRTSINNYRDTDPLNASNSATAR
jgi:hypothetical protein